MLLLGQIERTTKDLDLIALIKNNQLVSSDPLPQILFQVSEDVGKALELGKDWLNTAPASLNFSLEINKALEHINASS